MPCRWVGAAVVSCGLFLPQAVAQVVLNELMPVPPTGEPEWVELYNLSDTAVALTNWWIEDARTAVRFPPVILPARGYAVLSRDTAALREVRSLPASAVLVELRLPTLNNTTDILVLRTPDSLRVDSLYYSMRWGKAGVSLERRWAEKPATQENLLPCEAPSGATPGEVNSVTPLAQDYRLRDFRLVDAETLTLVVENAGTEPQGSALCRLWVDSDHDSSFAPAEERFQLSTPGLLPGQTWQAQIPAESLWTGLPEGWYTVRAAVELPGDERSWNDLLQRRFYRSARHSAVRINEILYDPPAGGVEFVELVNTGKDTVLLQHWTLRDGAGVTVTITAPVSLPPDSFAVLAWDSALVGQYPYLRGNPRLFIGSSSIALNNSGDAVVLCDPNGVVVDSVFYLPSWHDPVVGSSRRGRSLEKLHPLLPSSERSSWSSCGAPQGATPGLPNSIAIPPLPEGRLGASPNPFQISTAERRYCVISYELPFVKAQVVVRIFTDEGIPVRTLAHALYSASQGYVSWDGRTERGELVPPGPYVVLVEAEEVGGNRWYRGKFLLVVTY